MNNLMFVVLLLIFLSILLWKNVKRYLMDVMRICYNSSHSQCSCSLPSSGEKSDIRFENINAESQAQNCCECSEQPFYGSKAGYFLASNDEKNAPEYYPTSLQDVDPKDFA
jgi:hypothetical protein